MFLPKRETISFSPRFARLRPDSAKSIGASSLCCSVALGLSRKSRQPALASDRES